MKLILLTTSFREGIIFAPDDTDAALRILRNATCITITEDGQVNATSDSIDLKLISPEVIQPEPVIPEEDMPG